MPTTKPRLNLILNEKLEFWISKLAKYKGVSKTKIATDLLEKAISEQEDMIWTELADARKDEKLLTHEEVWGTPIK